MACAHRLTTLSSLSTHPINSIHPHLTLTTLCHYVLIGLTGYSSDDINKFLWPVRIGSGVFPNDMPGERDFMAGGNFDIGE